MLLCKSNVQFVATFLQVVKSLVILLLQPARNEFYLALLASRGSKFSFTLENTSKDTKEKNRKDGKVERARKVVNFIKFYQ